MAKSSNAVILARVSSKAQEDEGYSLDSQLKLLTNYFENKSIPVVKVFKITETASKQQSRKVFHELLNYIQKNDVCHLGVEKTDRLTRNFRDALAIDDWLEADGQRMLHAVKENMLLHKEAKSDVKFMWNIHLAVAKKYTDNLREEAMKGWAEKLAQGWLPSVPPPGYMTITEGGKRIHVPDPATKTIMQHIFRLYLNPNHSITTINKEMAALGIRTRKGRPLSRSHTAQILHNPFYIGINRFDGKDYPGVQETIISKELFDQVQQKLCRGKASPYIKHHPVFQGMICCSDCGGAVTWQLQKGRYYGGCQRKNSICKNNKLLREDMIEEIIIKQLQKLVCPSQEIISWVADSMRQEHRANVDNQERMVASIDIQLARLNRMDSELYDDKLAGEIPKEKYDIKHAQFEVQIDELETRKVDIAGTISQGLEKRLVILELAQKAATIYETRTPEQKRVIITKLFSKITSSNGLVSVNYTNFSRAIADKVEKTINLIGGQI